MNRKILKNSIIIIASFVYFFLWLFCAKGIHAAADFATRAVFYAVILKSTAVFTFLSFYYDSFVSDLGPDSALLPLFLMFSLFSELSISIPFAEITGLCPFSPLGLSALITFSRIMACLAILGFGFFYQRKERSIVSLYLAASFAASLILTYILPKTQNPETLKDNTALSILLGILFAATATIFIKHLITDPPGLHIIRHIAALLFIAGATITHFCPYSNRLFFLFGTVFIVISYVTILILSKIYGSKY